MELNNECVFTVSNYSVTENLYNTETVLAPNAQRTWLIAWINPAGSIRVVQINGEIFSADRQGIKLSINDQCEHLEWWLHSHNYLYLAAIYNPIFVHVCMYISYVWGYVWGQRLLLLLVSCRCLFVHGHECRCVCTKEWKQTGHKSWARKSNPPTLTNAWWRCHWNLDKVRIGPAVRGSYCAGA